MSLNLAVILKESASERPEKPALILGAARLSYGAGLKTRARPAATSTGCRTGTPATRSAVTVRSFSVSS
jgi:hypothetical protein